jgi:hypothetical protein
VRAAMPQGQWPHVLMRRLVSPRRRAGRLRLLGLLRRPLRTGTQWLPQRLGRRAESAPAASPREPWAGAPGHRPLCPRRRAVRLRPPSQAGSPPLAMIERPSVEVLGRLVCPARLVGWLRSAGLLRCRTWPPRAAMVQRLSVGVLGRLVCPVRLVGWLEPPRPLKRLGCRVGVLGRLVCLGRLVAWLRSTGLLRCQPGSPREAMIQRPSAEVQEFPGRLGCPVGHLGSAIVQPAPGWLDSPSRLGSPGLLGCRPGLLRLAMTGGQ